MSFARLAPAKVNLFLHVAAPLDDGYHPLASWAVFADVGDRLTLEPAEDFEFLVQGPFSAKLALEPDNLVLRAVRALEARIEARFAPVRVVLDKALPVASGLGGGSSDAGAALKLFRDAFDLPVADPELEEIAAELGADGPMCLHARPCLAEGRGERLSRAPRLPEVWAVLVNPGVPSPTGAVYRAYDEAGDFGGADLPRLPEAIESVDELAAMLAFCRNDLEAPAVRLVPAIGEALAFLRQEPEALFVRMSGSGASAFVLTVGEIEARGLAERLSRERPGWWARACRLGGPWG